MSINQSLFIEHFSYNGMYHKVLYIKKGIVGVTDAKLLSEKNMGILFMSVSDGLKSNM